MGTENGRCNNCNSRLQTDRRYFDDGRRPVVTIRCNKCKTDAIWINATSEDILRSKNMKVRRIRA
jgi:hypothetical protein